MKDLRAMVSSGKPCIGIFAVTASPAMVEAIGYSGMDFVIIDCEHAALSAWGTELEECVRAAYAADITPLVRVTENSKGMTLKALNFGAKGIITPHINTREDAEKLVRFCKYAPEGRRSAAPPVRAAKYGFTPFSEFWKQQNKENLVIPIIEEKDGLENLPQILEVKGLDVIFYGPFDMSMTYGLEAVCDHPTIWKGLDKTVELSKAKGLPVMNLCWDVKSAVESIKRGALMIALSVDMVVFRQGLQALLANMGKELKAATPAPKTGRK
jgi:4-hydroxy-2-oxoheptanedioate aldolase